MEKSSVKTCIRFRPLVAVEKECTDVRSIVGEPESPNTCQIIDPLYFKTRKANIDVKAFMRKFLYDHILYSVDPSSASYSSQDDVYLACGQSLAQSCLEGYNCCLIAYGMTGSG
jgi:hypothetical protein